MVVKTIFRKRIKNYNNKLTIIHTYRYFTLLYFTFFTDWARNPYSMRPDLGLLADPIADLYSSKPRDQLLDHQHPTY